MFRSRVEFSRWRIEWRYFWFDQIQDTAAILENSNGGDISSTDYRIHSVQLQSMVFGLAD